MEEEENIIKSTPMWLLSNIDIEGSDWLYEWIGDVGVFNHDQAEGILLFTRFPEFEWTWCPHCASKERHYEIEENNRWKCKTCGKKFSLYSKTYLDNTKLKAEYWCRICYILTKMRTPVNSTHISKDLLLTQKTVYGMLTTIKRSLKIDRVGINFEIPIQVEFRDLLERLLTIDNG